MAIVEIIVLYRLIIRKTDQMKYTKTLLMVNRKKVRTKNRTKKKNTL